MNHLLPGYRLSIAVLFILFSPVLVQADDFDHSVYDELLQKHVDETGRVNYRDWIKQDLQLFKAYMARLGNADLSNMSENARFAFWINAYNACTILGVINRYPLESVRPSFLGIPNQSFFNESVYEVAGKVYSLNDIEHGILRTVFKDPRLHFSIVCASIGCPNLHNRAFAAGDLDKALDERTRKFINDPLKNFVDEKEKTIYLSKIFKWFEEDFERTHGSVKSFVIAYLKYPDPAALETFDLDHLSYNWNLNEKR